MRLLKLFSPIAVTLSLVFSAQAQDVNTITYEERTALPEPEWQLITSPDWKLEKFKVYARRGHPEGRIRNIMKTYATPVRNGNGRARNAIDFKSLGKTGKGRLETFLMRMSNAPIHQVSPREALAYWLNVRNMLILKALTDESKFKKSKTGRGTPENPGNVWTEDSFAKAGENFSIQDIEQKILQLGKSDKRILYALYQGSLGGPTLPASGFTPQFLDQQLDMAARHFVGDPLHFTVLEGKIRVPGIYAFYRSALFDGSEAAIRTHLNEFAEGIMAEALTAGYPLEYSAMDYKKDSSKQMKVYTEFVGENLKPITRIQTYADGTF